MSDNWGDKFMNELGKMPKADASQPLNDLLCFDFKDKHDITLQQKLHTMMEAFGFSVDSYAQDEDGHSHCLKIENKECEGALHTENGVLVCLEVYLKP